jgi:hypothetical protein
MILGTKFQLKKFLWNLFGKFGVAKLPLKVIFMIGGFFFVPNSSAYPCEHKQAIYLSV